MASKVGQPEVLHMRTMKAEQYSDFDVDALKRHPDTEKKAGVCLYRGFHKMKSDSGVPNGPGRDSSEDPSEFCVDCGFDLNHGFGLL